MRPLWTLFLLLPLFASSQDIATRADALLTAYHRQDQFEGTVLIAKKGKVVFEKAYGLADREKQRPNTTATEYRIGSVTKPFTAALILKLQEEGILSVKDPVSKHLPGYPKGDSILLEHLLTHTSGIRSITSMKQYYDQWISEPASLELTVSRFREEPLRFTAGQKFEYSNSNYILLSHIAEKVTGTSFAKLMNDRIFKKLGLAHTGMDDNDRQSMYRAAGYQSSPEKDFAPARFNDMSLIAGAGAMYSTVRDLYTWDRALYGNKVLSEASRKQMFTPYRNKYGYGWSIDTVKGRLEISHSGSIDGYKSNIIRYPEQDVCIIFLSNYFESKGPQISEALTAIVFGEPYEMPRERKFIKLPEAQLKAYEGNYQMEKGPGMKIFLENGQLKGRLGQQAPFTLLAESERQFYIKPIDSEVVFTLEKARVTELKIQQGKKMLSFKKAE